MKSFQLANVTLMDLQLISATDRQVSASASRESAGTSAISVLEDIWARLLTAHHAANASTIGTTF